MCNRWTRRCACRPVSSWHDLLMRRLSLFVSALAFSFVSSARESTLLDSGWRFKSGDITNAETANFGDGGWQTVSIPHNWERIITVGRAGIGANWTSSWKPANDIFCGSKRRVWSLMFI